MDMYEEGGKDVYIILKKYGFLVLFFAVVY